MVQALLWVFEAEQQPLDIRRFLARAFSELAGDHSAEQVLELEVEIASLNELIAELQVRLERFE